MTYNNYKNYHNYRMQRMALGGKVSAGNYVDKGIDSIFGLFGAEDTAAADIVSGVGQGVAGYFTGDYGSIAKGAGQFIGGTGKIADDVANKDTAYGNFAEIADTGGQAVGSFMQGDISGGIQNTGLAAGQIGNQTGNEGLSNFGQYGQMAGNMFGMYQGLRGQGIGQNMTTYKHGGNTPMYYGKNPYEELQVGSTIPPYAKLFGTYKYGGEIGNDRTGMMKARMAYANHFGNPAAQRMVSPNPKTGMTPKGQGTHYMTSVDNYAVPLLQDTGGKNLTYIENPAPSIEDIKFDSPEDAEYFAKNYKSIAPMMYNKKYGGNLYAQGGPVYEAEGGEVIEGGMPKAYQGGEISATSSNTGMIKGNSHNEGGVKMSGGERIYSDSLYLDDDFINSLDI